MHADSESLHHRTPRLAGLSDRFSAGSEKEDTGEESCPAFGFLRGLNDRSLMIEFRFKNGNSEALPYGWLGAVRYNPSVGILLKFTGDVVTLVLIRGSNLDADVKDQAVNLTDRGLLKHRILWVREMDEDELRRAGKGEATIDRIEVVEFESIDEQRKWLGKHAAEFLRSQD
jgi:hypothetical protein